MCSSSSGACISLPCLGAVAVPEAVVRLLQAAGEGRPGAQGGRHHAPPQPRSHRRQLLRQAGGGMVTSAAGDARAGLNTRRSAPGPAGTCRFTAV